MEFSDNNFDPLLMGEIDVAAGGSAKIVDEITILLSIPPADEIYLDSNFFERSLGLFDLGLEPSVC